jgi:uncharacterized protein YigE (DUF2233 family)
MRMIATGLLVLVIALATGFAMARARAPAPGYTVVPVEAAELRLYWRDEAGRPFRTFRRLDAWLHARGQRLEFAMNAGMYHADFSPVGLLVVDGRELAPLERGEGKGNFFLKPNGVFYVDARGAHVVATEDFPMAATGVRLATQSGPLLVRHGKIHPAFDPASRSRHLRNGVGLRAGKPVFAISRGKVTLHEFAAYFRDTLQCEDALYLDGAVSSLHSRELRRSDARAPLGPIVAVVGGAPAPMP